MGLVIQIRKKLLKGNGGMGNPLDGMKEWGHVGIGVGGIGADGGRRVVPGLRKTKTNKGYAV